MNTDLHDVSDEDFTYEHNEVIRMKWSIDGCANFDEIIKRLFEKIKEFEALRENGWRLREPVNDDYGFIYRAERSRQGAQPLTTQDHIT